MLKHPKIKQAYVLGQQQLGQPNDKLIYFIVGDITETEVAGYCKQNLLFAWRPDKVILLDDLPRTASGKPKIGALKDIAKESA